MVSAGGDIATSVVRERPQPEVRRSPTERVVRESASRRTLYGLGSWRLTQLISRSQKITIYRARPRRETIGLGCYLIKAATAGQQEASLAKSLLYREAQVAATVASPHVSVVLATNWNSAYPHLARPYLDGVSLRQLLNRTSCRTQSLPSSLPIEFALAMARQVASGLAALHAEGWLHSQVRPEHVMISPQGHATLIDLTLARRLDGRECESEGACSEVPRYASPEAFAPHARLTAAADIYSLGLVLYETLTGQPPFPETDLKRLITCHRCSAPPEVRQLCPLASRDVSELLRRMLAKEPLRRPTAEQAVRWLAELEIEELCV